ncbi:MAG: hypothetical protein KJ057_16400 [Phycisphaerae bacterium]|nr:hypothetical protein [Planctomycetia bacterium]MCK6466318.1 hypothetical protein [Phycisphaerae bacterium]MCL4720050.1 hypothetical protein [Phycisphaerae bacterium]NUQ10334.1 hypothetical protein [Phycisphaerae bacterium]
MAASTTSAENLMRGKLHVDGGLHPRIFVHVGSGYVGVLTLCVVAAVAGQRWEHARDRSWRCDELPAVVQRTGLAGQAANEAAARAFSPTMYTFRHGIVRALKPPTTPASVQPLASFWAHLGFHAAGYSTLAARFMPWLWSLVAIACVGVIGAHVGGGARAGCLCALVFALSPLASVYAAQARGYSETTAAAALLCIAVEVVRRRPRSAARIAFLIAVSVQTAATVFTTWVYWTAPVLLVACDVIPLQRPSRELKAHRATFRLVFGVVAGFVGLYALDRTESLTGLASDMGDRLRTWADAVAFASALSRDVLGGAAWLLPAGAAGIWVLARGDYRWWLAALLGCGLVIIGVTAGGGSAGYTRNLVFLAVPASVLIGCGLEVLLSAATTWWGANVVTAASGSESKARQLRWTGAGVLMLAGSVAATVGVRDLRARTLAHVPDWGAAVRWAESRPPTDDVRWLLRCQGFRNVLDWYAGAPDPMSLLNVGDGEHVEFMMLMQRDPSGEAVCYVPDRHAVRLNERRLPDFLRERAAPAVVEGVEIRIWRGVRRAEAAGDPRGGGGFVIAVRLRERSADALWRDILNTAPQLECAAIPFGVTPGVAPPILATAVASEHAETLIQVLQRVGPVSAEDVRVFEMFAPEVGTDGAEAGDAP